MQSTLKNEEERKSAILRLDANTAVRGKVNFHRHMKYWSSFITQFILTHNNIVVVFKEAHRKIECDGNLLDWKAILTTYFPFLTEMGMVAKGDEKDMAFGFVVAKYGDIPKTWTVEREQIGLYPRHHYDAPTRCSANAALLIMNGDECIYMDAHLTLPTNGDSKKAWKKEVDDLKNLLENKSPRHFCADMNWLTTNEKSYCNFSFLPNPCGLNENHLTFVAWWDDCPPYKILCEDAGGNPDMISYPFGAIRQGGSDEEPQLRPCSSLDLSSSQGEEHYLGYPVKSDESNEWDICFTDARSMTLNKALEIKKEMTAENPYRMDHLVQLFVF